MIRELFDEAERVYKQTPDSFFVTKRTYLGIHFAAIERFQRRFFSVYTLDPPTIKGLRGFTQRGVFKTYDCSMCTIEEPNNVSFKSPTQGILEESKNPPSVRIRRPYTTRLQYFITGTEPPYFYNHLLLTSQSHIPTYALFTDEDLFTDVF